MLCALSVLIFVLNMPKEHISQRTQAFKSHQSQMIDTPCPVTEMEAKNNPFSHQDCDCMLAFL